MFSLFVFSYISMHYRPRSFSSNKICVSVCIYVLSHKPSCSPIHRWGLLSCSSSKISVYLSTDAVQGVIPFIRFEIYYWCCKWKSINLQGNKLDVINDNWNNIRCHKRVKKGMGNYTTKSRETFIIITIIIIITSHYKSTAEQRLPQFPS